LTRELRGRVGGRESQENEKERNAKDFVDKLLHVKSTG